MIEVKSIFKKKKKVEYRIHKFLERNLRLKLRKSTYDCLVGKDQVSHGMKYQMGIVWPNYAQTIFIPRCHHESGFGNQGPLI